VRGRTPSRRASAPAEPGLPPEASLRSSALGILAYEYVVYPNDAEYVVYPNDAEYVVYPNDAEYVVVLTAAASGHYPTDSIRQ